MVARQTKRPAAGAARQARDRIGRLLRAMSITDEPIVLLLCVASIVVLGFLAVQFPDVTPIATMVVPLLVAGMFLRPRALILVDLTAIAMICYVAARLQFGAGGVRVASVFVLAATAIYAHFVSSSRERLGVQGLRGDAMLLELRDRLGANGAPPMLPVGWHAELVQHSAGGALFGGDFVVSTLSDDEKRLELAVVDVSGKGIDAATRALQLSGALGGLLGAVPPRQFLVAANSYVLRQGWMDGFATAVHLAVDLATGDFSISSAGHPPVVHFDAGAGHWRTLDVDGAMLGLQPCTGYEAKAGTIRHGDALLLYTDGLIEVPGRDLAIGVDKLLGEAERLVTVGFADGARRLIDAVAPDGADDRALVMLWRS